MLLSLTSLDEECTPKLLEYFDSLTMDPLSVIASVIAISGAVATSLEQVRKFYGAEADVLGLINEVSDLRLILEGLDQTIQERGQHVKLQKDRVLAIISVLKRAQTEFEALNQAIKGGVFRTDPETGKDKVSRTSWMRKKSRILRLQSQIKDTRVTLSTLCSNASL